MATEAQALGQEADERMLHLCNSRCRRDPTSPILRLPSEMLAALFIHYARDYYHEQYGNRIRWIPNWVNVSYVCRHWRDVALNCPTLWTYHFVLSLRWTEELLARSKQASLNICVHVGRDPEDFCWLAVLEKLMNHGERIQEFHLAFPYGISVPEMLPKLSFRPRRLRSLTIILPEQNGQERLDPSIDLPPLLLDGDTPAPTLRELVLSCCPVPWHLLTSSPLTILCLRDIPIHFRKDTVEFLGMLASMQSLTQLCLDLALADTPGHQSTMITSSAPPKVNLPCLTRLLIAAPFPTIMTMLSCINIPLGAELRLNILESEPAVESTPENYGLLSSLLAHRFEASHDPASPLPTIRSLVVHNHTLYQQGHALIFSSLDRDCNNSRLMSEAWNMDNNEWDCSIPLKIFIAMPMSMKWNDRDRIISDICRPLPLENVQSVHIIALHMSLGLWGEIFGRFPGLRHLKIREGNMPDISSVLSDPPPDRTEAHGGDLDQSLDQKYMFAPALEELELQGIRFVPEPTESFEHVHWPQYPVLPSLLDVLSKRKTRCKLTMTECSIGDPYGLDLDIINVDGRWEDDEFKVEYTQAELSSSSCFSEEDDPDDESMSDNLASTDEEH